MKLASILSLYLQYNASFALIGNDDFITVFNPVYFYTYNVFWHMHWYVRLGMRGCSSVRNYHSWMRLRCPSQDLDLP